MDATAKEIRDGLIRLLGASGNRKRLLIEGGSGYIAFSTTPGQDALQAQAAGGRHLPEGTRMSPESAQRLGDAGLRQRRASENYLGQVHDLGSSLELWTSRAAKLLAEVYGATPDEVRVTLRSEEQPVLDNQSLLDAMDTLAKQRDWKARTDVYMQLIVSQLVLALAKPHDGALADVGQVHHAGAMAGLPVVAVFSDVAALDRYEPRGLDLRVMEGSAVFPFLHSLKIASVLINPRGAPRGELYMNELWTIVQGIKRLGRG